MRTQSHTGQKTAGQLIFIGLRAASTRLLQGTGAAAPTSPASGRSILGPEDRNQSHSSGSELRVWMQREKNLFLDACSSSYLWGHVVGVPNHHRAGEVFMQVLHVFTHSGTEKTGAGDDVIAQAKSL